MSLHDDDNPFIRQSVFTPVTCLVMAYILGLVIGHQFAYPLLFLIAAAGASLFAVICHVWLTDRHVVKPLALLAILTIGAGHIAIVEIRVASNDIARYITAHPQLVQVVGHIVSDPYQTTAPESAFARFTYHQPATCFTLKLDSIMVTDQPRPISGRLLVRIAESDHRPRRHQRIEATGWISTISQPLNPGQFDYHAYTRRHDIAGSLRLSSRDHYQILEQDSTVARLLESRQFLIHAATQAMHDNMPEDSRQLALLDTILLGQNTSQLNTLYDSFRQVGLAHILAISGAHLAILLSIIYMIARLFIHHPRKMAVVLLFILGLYLLIVPWRVPILRAALMASLYLLGQITGRRSQRLDFLALAALILLLMRPGDLFTPGFQLSFAVVLGILLFARPLSDHMLPEQIDSYYRSSRGIWRWLLKKLVEYTSVCIIAFFFAQPLLAYHFKMLNPLAVFASLLVFPFITALLFLGYLKILASLLLPTLAAWLAWPLDWLAWFFVRLVDESARLPAMAIALGRHAPFAWTLVTLSLFAAIFSGRFKCRPAALIASLAIVTTWLWLVDPLYQPAVVRSFINSRADTAITLDTLAVGDGSCHILRIPSETGDEPITVIFDAGSRSTTALADRIIIPALQHMGIRQIDYLFISHPDIDHYIAVLDIADHLPVDKVFITPQFKREASTNPDKAAVYLLEQLAARDIEVDVITSGWKAEHHHVNFQLLWPKDDYLPEKDNDGSMLLSVEAAGRRLLFTGDLGQEAATIQLSADMNLVADITTLPHHGAYSQNSVDLITQINPTHIIQSTSPKYTDRADWLQSAPLSNLTHLSTAARGHIHFTITQTGDILYRTFVQPSQK